MTRFRRWARDAIAAHPAPDGLPIHVRRVAPRDGSLGDVSRQSDRWMIRVHPSLGDQLAWWVLLHELAHVHSWDSAVDHSDCGRSSCAHWGCAFARLWRDHHHDADHAA